MNTPVYDHEQNADVVMELLDLLDVTEAMVAGYSSGMFHVRRCDLQCASLFAFIFLNIIFGTLCVCNMKVLVSLSTWH